MKTKNKRIILYIIMIICIIIIIFSFSKIQKNVLKSIYKLGYSEYVYKYSEENDIDPFLIFSIIKVESNFNEHSTSKSNAIGLMQIMENTAYEVAKKINDLSIKQKEEIYNPNINIKIGTYYFKYLYNYYNENINLSLAAYNAGIGNVDKWIKDGIINEDGTNIENIPYKETNNYVRKVLRDYRIYNELYSEKI